MDNACGGQTPLSNTNKGQREETLSPSSVSDNSLVKGGGATPEGYQTTCTTKSICPQPEMK